MLKTVAAGATALLLVAAPFAYAQTSSDRVSSQLSASGPLSAAQWNALTDLRVDLVKAALQLTPEQTKLWPAVEEAIRARAQDLLVRASSLRETVGAAAAEDVIDRWRNRDPVKFLQLRADHLERRAANVRKLADAWGPLYQTLKPEQKRRMAALTLLVLQNFRSDVAERLLESDDEVIRGNR
jgi:hypothetical protein